MSKFRFIQEILVKRYWKIAIYYFYRWKCILQNAIFSYRFFVQIFEENIKKNDRENLLFHKRFLYEVSLFLFEYYSHKLAGYEKMGKNILVNVRCENVFVKRYKENRMRNNLAWWTWMKRRWLYKNLICKLVNW